MSSYMAVLQYKVECPVLHMTIHSCTSWTFVQLGKVLRLIILDSIQIIYFQDESEIEQSTETAKKGACPLGCALVNINSRETCKTWKILQKFARCDR